MDKVIIQEYLVLDYLEIVKLNFIPKFENIIY